MAVSARGAWREWIEFFLRGVAEQARDAVVRAKQLQDLQAEWRKRLAKARASALLLRLADRLFESPVVTIPQAKDYLKITYPSAQRNVEKLVVAKILRPLGGAAYGKTFIADEIFQVIGGKNTESNYTFGAESIIPRD
jgi:Fic family protein